MATRRTPRPSTPTPAVEGVVATIVEPPISDTARMWLEVGALKAHAEDQAAKHGALATQVAAILAKIEALPAEMDVSVQNMMQTLSDEREQRLSEERTITTEAIAQVEARMAPLAELTAFMREETAARERQAREAAAAHARQDARYDHITRLLRGLGPFMTVLIAVVLASAWQHMANVPGHFYWTVVGVVLALAALFYLWMVERDRKGPRP